MEELKLNIDAFLPLRDVVFNTLRDAILNGELEPGERLMEIHLANKLGVSRTPIREAIRMLENEGLAVTVPRKGAQVTKITEKDLEDALEVREALDAFAVECACARMEEEDFCELEKAMDNFIETTKHGEIREIVEADEEFHNVIYRSTKNPKLMSIVAKIKEQVYRYRYEYIRGNKDFSQLVEEHEKILDGLRRKDTGYVKEIMQTHLENLISGVKELIRRQDGE